MPSIIFPLEIEEMILDILGEDDEGHSALKRCSLVCQAFLPICRKHIFGSIILNDCRVVPPTTSLAFERLIRKTPEIADYIRKLDYTIQIEDLISPSIQESLKRISRLEYLTVGHLTIPTLDWGDNLIRPLLLHLLHLPTLTHFELTDIRNFIASDLISCINLKYLNIGRRTTVAVETTLHPALSEHSIQLNEFVSGTGTSAAIMKLCSARRLDGQLIIDFGSLSKITVDIEESDEGEASLELFRHCHALTNVNVSLLDPQNFRPNLADMLKPLMPTLKHIVVIFHVYDCDVDPLIGFPSELEVIHTRNIIETIDIRIVLEMVPICRRGDEWGRLDEVLTTPGWCSLKQVSLVIEIAGSFAVRADELELALEKLLETQFPRLSSSNSVAFDFDVFPLGLSIVVGY